MDQNLEFWGAIAGILGLFIAILALLRDIFNFQLQWAASGNSLKRLAANRWIQVVIAVALVGFAYWALYNRVQTLGVVVNDREQELTLAYATQTAQVIDIMNKATNTPDIREIPVTVIAEKEVTAIIEREVAVFASTHTPQPTYTLQPTYTALPPLPTYTPYPTSRPSTPVIKIATATPEPIPTEPANTPPSRVLEVGEWWKEDGVWLTLKEVEFSQGGKIYIYLELYNKTGDDVMFNWEADVNFSLEDNTGHRYIDPWGGNQEIIESNKKVSIANSIYPFAATFTDDHFFDPAVTDMIFSVSDFSRISRAQWRIPVNK